MKKTLIILLLVLCFYSIGYADESWNPSDKNALIDLSNGDKTATTTSETSDHKSVRGTVNLSGKVYWEIDFINGGIDQRGMIFGIGNSSESLDEYPGKTTNGYGYTNNSLGSVYLAYNGLTLWSEGDVYGTSGTLMFAFDATAGEIYYGLNGTWMDSSNPATNTNPHQSGISGTFYPMVSLPEENDTVTIVTNESDCTYTAPSGYSYYFEPPVTISGTLELDGCTNTTAAVNYFLVDASSSPHTLYAYGTTDTDGTYSENVADTDDEYCGIQIGQGMVYAGTFATATSAGDGTFTLYDPSWATGSNQWYCGIDPTMTKKTVCAKGTVNASHQISDTYQHDGVAESGGLIIGFDFGTTGDNGYLKPVYDYATGN